MSQHESTNEREVFMQAIDISDLARRAEYLAKACVGNEDLRSRVDALLRTHEETSQFLETPVMATVASMESSTVADPQSKSGDKEFRKYFQPTRRPGWLGRLAHYEIEAILGRGAFGIVFKAFDERLHRVVAIKMMHPELATTSPPRKRFLREARTAAAISHENIVAIHAVEDEPIPYLVMEYVAGETLQQRMDSRGPLEILDVLRIAQQIADGLAAAHSVNLIHRDVKPSNILITDGPTERVKITDFGMARAVDDAALTASGLIAGTPLYMAPEQARGVSLDHRADLFSLGSVLYQMIAGRPPFRAPSTLAVLKRVCEDTPRPLNDVMPQTPSWLQSIVSRLLAKDRQERFQTASEVADLMAQCVSKHQLGDTESLKRLSVEETAYTKNIVAVNEAPADNENGQSPIFLRTGLAVLACILALLAIAGWTMGWGRDERATSPVGDHDSESREGVLRNRHPTVDGWTDVFDGKTLAGWQTTDTRPEAWSVQQDAIVVEGEGRGYLYREFPARDFEVMLEYRTLAPSNRGVITRAPDLQLGSTKAIEFTLIDKASLSQTRLRQDGGIGLPPVDPDPLKNLQLPPGEWNQVRLRMQGPRGELWFNGHLVARRFFRELDQWVPQHTALTREAVRVVLQHWGPDRVEFRDIRVRELISYEPPTATEDGEAQDLSNIYGGAFGGSQVPPVRTSGDSRHAQADFGTVRLDRCVVRADAIVCEFTVTSRHDLFRFQLALGGYQHASVAVTESGEELRSIRGSIGKESGSRFVSNAMDAQVPLKCKVEFERREGFSENLRVIRLAGDYRQEIVDKNQAFQITFEDVPLEEKR